MTGISVESDKALTEMVDGLSGIALKAIISDVFCGKAEVHKDADKRRRVPACFGTEDGIPGLVDISLTI
jgi:hypothetical protein